MGLEWILVNTVLETPHGTRGYIRISRGQQGHTQVPDGVEV